jgi:hypothetical protein
MNLKYEVIFHINIVNFLYYLDVVIEFIGDYIKIYEGILRKEWIHNELLNQWHFVDHKVKIWHVNFLKCDNTVKFFEKIGQLQMRCLKI